MEKALFGALMALSRTLLRMGVDYQVFASVARCAYVTAARQLERGDTEPSIAQLSSRTGLNARSVKEVLDANLPRLQAGETEVRSVTYLAHVLATWFRGPEYQDEQGQPRELAVVDAEHGFEALVRACPKDIPARAVLSELIQAGAVEESRPGWVRILREDYAPRSNAQYEERFGEVLEDMVTTLGCNLLWHGAPDDRIRDNRSLQKLDRRMVEEFRVFSRQVLEGTVKDLNQWLIAKKAQSTEPEPQQVRVGYGVYAISDARAEECGFK